MFSAGKSSYALWTLPALFISKALRKKFILNYHDGQVQEHLDRWRIAAPTLRLADVIISPSDYVVKIFAQRGIPARRIYNIVDSSRFLYRRRRQLCPAFFTNRMLEPLYNVACVLRAFALVQKRYPHASLTIAHDGPCRPALEQLARDLALRNTCFMGQVAPEKLPELYNSADIYMMSPDIDCMPLSVLECFCSGLPVIATAVGGIPYLVEHQRTGLLVNRNDHQSMADCAIRLLEDPDLVEYLTGNARQEIERYSADCIRGQWMALYRDMSSGCA
jgi:glycosyltransferase involved in cell wall biosynthesis